MARSSSRSNTESGSSERPARSLKARLLPYSPPWALAAAAPVAGLVAHHVWGVDPDAAPWATLGAAGGTAALTWLTWRIGQVREMVIRWHSTLTVAAAGTAETITLINGLSRPWLDICLGGGALFAASWNLRRFDALRSDTSENAPEKDTWGEILGLAKSRPGKPKQIGARVEVPIHHGGGNTVRDIQNALPAIESAAGALPGRSRVVEDPDNAGKSTLVLVTEDVLKNMIPWPGPNHPGGSIVDPLEPGRYEDDEPALFWFPGEPGRAPTNVIYMGVTRAGKTLTALVNTANMMTRRDVVIWWADLTKGSQTAGPIRDGLDVYADTPAKAKAMFKSLQDIVRARADALGNAGYRQWEPACYLDERLHMPYLVAHFEEADEIVADNDKFTWLTGKALSTGVSISVSLQRADHGSMPTTARYNITSAFCFGVGDDYSAQFALTSSTIDAGAHPERWGARRQGYFYLEANGVDETRFPIPARGYYASDDQIEAVVAQHASGRARLDGISATAAGDFYTSMTAAPPTPARTENTTVTSQNANDDVDDDMAELAAEIQRELPPQPADELLDGGIDPHAPIPAWTGEDMQFGAKPAAVSKEQAEAAFDQLLQQMANEGVEEFRVKDLLERYPYKSRPWVSKRLTALAEGALVLPPGLALTRLDVLGRYRLERLANVKVLANA